VYVAGEECFGSGYQVPAAELSIEISTPDSRLALQVTGYLSDRMASPHG
jgi:hypothetical protein